jgi:hypothetical protein
MVFGFHKVRISTQFMSMNQSESSLGLNDVGSKTKLRGFSPQANYTD